MNVYIDAAFSFRPGAELQVEKPLLMSSDSVFVLDTPPFKLKPECVLLSVGDGHGEFFVSAEDGDNVAEKVGIVISELEKAYGSVTLVGWYLDQVVIPALCVDAVVTGKPLHPRLMRKLDDKWSKPSGISLERAFYQGWYPFSREFTLKPETPGPMTVHNAYELCGLGKFKDLVGYWTVVKEEEAKADNTDKPETPETPDKPETPDAVSNPEYDSTRGVLVARCEAMKAIHGRHDSIAYGRKVS